MDDTISKTRYWAKMVKYVNDIPDQENFFISKYPDWKMGDAMYHWLDCFFSSSTYDQNWNRAAGRCGHIPGWDKFRKAVSGH